MISCQFIKIIFKIHQFFVIEFSIVIDTITINIIIEVSVVVVVHLLLMRKIFIFIFTIIIVFGKSMIIALCGITAIQIIVERGRSSTTSPRNFSSLRTSA